MERIEKNKKTGRTLISFCPDLRVFDVTMRDGGLVNNFQFTDEFVSHLYKANIDAGVDYMEFGYKADKDIFNPEDFGKWKFCNEEDIRAIVGNNDSDLKISVMADVGRTNYKRDFLPKSESVIDIVRVAMYIHQIPAAIEMIKYIKNLGYEVSANLMAVSKVNHDLLADGIRMLCESGIDVLYIVDSFGNYYPEQMTELSKLYCDIASEYGIKVGIHAHNNQQLAFANTIEAMRQGADYLDATVCGMGRGAGNCFLESLLGFLKNPKYSIVPIMRLIQNDMNKVREAGAVWGFDIQYMLTGILNTHPRPAIAFTKEKRNDYFDFYQELLEND